MTAAAKKRAPVKRPGRIGRTGAEVMAERIEEVGRIAADAGPGWEAWGRANAIRLLGTFNKKQEAGRGRVTLEDVIRDAQTEAARANAGHSGDDWTGETQGDFVRRQVPKSAAQEKREAAALKRGERARGEEQERSSVTQRQRAAMLRAMAVGKVHAQGGTEGAPEVMWFRVRSVRGFSCEAEPDDGEARRACSPKRGRWLRADWDPRWSRYRLGLHQSAGAAYLAGPSADGFAF